MVLVANVLFSACVVFTMYMLFISSKKQSVLWFSIAWLSIMGMALISGFFENTHATPPRLPVLLGPLIVLFIILFSTRKGRAFLSEWDVEKLLLLSLVRIPVELCLFWLYAAGSVPIEMTFEGRNFDIFAGLLVPIVWYYAFRKEPKNKWVLYTWNILGIVLLTNIIVTAILSVDTPFQVFGQNQPNIAVLGLPFGFLACYVAPAVLFSHMIIFMKWIQGSLFSLEKTTAS
jgi:hypothetical protein